jgi:hypothetical protein
VIKFIFSFILFFLLVAEPYAQSFYTYVLDYNAKPTTSWEDTQTGVTYYELRLVGIKTTGELVPLPSEQLSSSVKEKQLTRPRTGDFKVQIRACNGSKCSEWADSKDPQYATVNGQPMGWILRWKVPKPGGIIIGLWYDLKNFFGGETNV